MASLSLGLLDLRMGRVVRDAAISLGAGDRWRSTPRTLKAVWTWGPDQVKLKIDLISILG
jgi:hypothetical protein